VLADVRQGFLRRSEHREPRIRVEGVALAGDRDRRGNAGVALELGNQGGQPFRPGQLVVPEHADRAARLLDSAARELVSALERGDELGVAAPCGTKTRSLELERETRQRVCEDVVHLAGETLALGEHRSARLGVARLLELAHELLRLFLLHGELPGEPGDHEERDDAEHLQRRRVTALGLAGDLRDGQRHESEDDDCDARPAAHAQCRCRDRDERAEDRRALRLQRHQRRRAEHEHREERRLDGDAAVTRVHGTDDSDDEPDESEKDPEVFAAQAWSRMRLRSRDHDERDPEEAERAHHLQHPRSAHAESVGPSAACVVGGRVEAWIHPRVETGSTGQPMMRRSTAPTVPAMIDIVISAHGLAKRYGNVDAVRGVDLEVRRGEIFAFLGPNGAGKTTTVEILEGFRTASAGEVSVLGVDPARAGSEWRNRVGAVLQESQAEAGLTVRECLELYAGYYEKPRAIGETIALVGLEEKVDARTEHLSGGQQRRLDVALALIGDPELVFLDEPTTGFDPSARRAAWSVIDGLRALGKTVFLTTHYMDEAEHLADHIAVIAGGTIVAEGTPHTLGNRDRLAATIRFTLPVGAKLPESLQPLVSPSSNGVVAIRTESPLQHVRALADWAATCGFDLHDLDVRRPTLEEVYLSLTEHGKEES
jgi:ABC-2 type transport system ATP-binding protein